MSLDLGELGNLFRANSRRRLDEMRTALASMNDERLSRDSLRTLAHHFHGLTGLGATYGYSRLTELASIGEQTSAELVKKGALPDPDTLRTWGDLIEAMSAALQVAPEMLVFPEAGQSNGPRQSFDVLIAVSDPSLIARLRPLVEAEAISVRSAVCGRDAISAIDAAIPDALICDIHFEDGSGLEVIRYLRGLAGGDAAGALAISVRNEFLDKVEVIQSGVDVYFEAPLDSEALIRRLLEFRDRKFQPPARILSMEDDRHQAEHIRAILETEGYLVHCCYDPREFESALLSSKPDLVLMDLYLPNDVSGIDLVRFLRKDPRFSPLPVVFVTTAHEIEAMINTIRAGGDDHLIKPVDRSLLLSTVASRIARAQVLRAETERDGLTGLLTHTAFKERAQAMWAKGRRAGDGRPVLVMIDVDHFKKVNDTYGHLAGDRVLAALGAFLRERVRQSDLLARYGGEEFILRIANIGEEDARRLIERLIFEFQAIAHQAADGSVFHVTFSAGVTAFSESMTDFESWVEAVDAALYAAKQAGRARVICESDRRSGKFR